jgi:hypothetical protein
MKSLARTVSLVFISSLLGLSSCGDEEGGSGDDNNNDPDRPDETGAACMVADDCYPDVAEGELQGDAVCIDRVRGGYCTHTCETDDDCCAAEGECGSDLLEVCSPFESMEGMHCFVSCEAEDVEAATDVTDEQDFCQKKASSDFICRSSGGGNMNRKICVPGDCGVGANCTDDNDCDTDLECVTSVHGGYCTMRGCLADTDCGENRCVTVGDENYCHRPCTTASDCSLCRDSDSTATCRDDMTLVNPEMPGSVCVPD